MHPTNCRQLPLLCTSSWSYNSDGIIWSLFTAVSTNQKHNETSKPIPWLYVDSPRCYHLISCLLHNPEHSLWCLLPLCPKSTQPSRRLLFPRQPPTRWRFNQTKWRHPHYMHHPKACCSIGSKGWIGCPFPECTRGQNHATHPYWTWPSTTTNTNSYQQHNNGWHRQQYSQTTTITCYRNAIFLVTGWRITKTI